MHDQIDHAPAPRACMKLVGLCGYSGSGKTSLVERLVGLLKQTGARVSVIKHTHHAFEIDREGKDSWRHRKAGAYEVLLASDLRLAKMREFELQAMPQLHELVAELLPCDWVLVEGLKRADCPKLEVWRAATGHPLLYPRDPYVVAVCTDDRAALPADCPLKVLDLNDAGAVAGFLLAHADRFAWG